MIGKLSIQSKLMLMLLAVCLSSITAIALIGYSSGQQSLNKSIFNQLISLRESKAYQIESYFNNLRSQVQTISEMPSIISATKELSFAYQELKTQSIQANWSQKLKDYYNKEFLPRLEKNVLGKPLLFSYLPSGSASRYLQYYYIADNSNPVGQKSFLRNPQDGSKYSQIHGEIQDIYSNFIEKFGYYDLFLIDAKTSEIVYTVEKETDYATSLSTGPYSGSNLAKVVEKVRKNKDPGFVAISDFEPYRPSYAKPAAFLATPIIDNGNLIGVLAFQISINEINRIMTGGENWQRDGLGNSGETYLIGSDYTMRSVSRFLVEDKQKYLKTIENNDLPKSNIAQIEKLGTSILFQEVQTKAATKAIEGETGTNVGTDYRGVKTLSAFRPLDIQGLDWQIIAQIDEKEAFASILSFQKRVLFSTAILALIVTGIAAFLSHNFVKPINILIDGFRKVSEGNTNVAVKVKSKDEFKELTNSFNNMVDNLDRQKKLIQEKNQENEKLLLSILPEPVAKRLKGGEEKIADSFPNVTVMFGEILGFSDLSETLSASDTVSFLNDLVTAFDKAAEHYGVEKIKTIGSGYMAVSGLSVSRIDHTKRVVDFSLEMVRILNSFNRDRNTELQIKIGINSGEVVAGIVGKSKFIYDLWGDTVNIAHSLKTPGDGNRINVTDSIYNSLADIYDFHPGEKILTSKEEKISSWSISL